MLVRDCFVPCYHVFEIAAPCSVIYDKALVIVSALFQNLRKQIKAWKHTTIGVKDPFLIRRHRTFWENENEIDV